jgi:hypothetical protein
MFYCAAWLLAAAPGVRADDLPAAEAWNAHVQATYVWQAKPAFGAACTGPASLAPWRGTVYSFCATAAERYVDPEAVQGKAMSGLHGFGGMTNGGQQKTSGTSPTFHRAWLFLRQTWNLGGDMRAASAPGAGAFVGDGRLGWQHVANPAYDGARGPANVFGPRRHGQS